MDTISFEEFQKLDLRIGTIKEARRLENSKKLLELTVDFGDSQTTILAGIGKTVEDLTSLIGKQLPFVINLEPREIAGAVSHGMMLAANHDGEPVLLLPEVGVEPGSQIR